MIDRSFQGRAINLLRAAFAQGKRAPVLVAPTVAGAAMSATTISRDVASVEPYWRGPENAPILSRPYMVGR